MKITIANMLLVEEMPLELADRARRDVTAPNPEYVKRERLSLWLGGAKPELTLMTSNGDDTYLLPRGYYGRLARLARESKTPVTTVDKRLILPKIDLSFKGELRDYQRRAFERMIKSTDGVLVAPCGSGKTALGMSIIAHHRRPALILVHTLDLLRQTREAAWRWLGVEAGTIGGGKIDVGQITVGTIQTVNKHPELIKEFALVLLDESHHCPATTFMDTLQRFPAAYRYGLTATPNRDDGLGVFMTAVLGPIRHEITQEELRSAGVLVTPRVEFVRTDFSYPYANDWNDMISALIRDTDRNELIYKIICRLLDGGRRILALSQRVEHCEALYRAIERSRPGAAALAVGAMKKERAEGIRRIANGEAGVLFATQLADEGLDAPILDAEVLLTPQRNSGRTEQRIGRILRSLDGKRQPILIDLVDACIPILRSQAHSRFFNVYRELSPGVCLPGWLSFQRGRA
ncbi:MAG: DEAD/DEAH box helicase [Synergistaceae bacterium]|jgi:superfamily II DNA or RNA helicase|nr:DEAD/DEAH box helicase [Synergistaceae bacterium]